MSTTPRRARLLVFRAALLTAVTAASVSLGGCRDFGDVTGSISGSSQTAPTDETALREYSDRWAKAYDANPGEKIASMNYARALRAQTRYDEAVAVMRVAAIKSPKDFQVLGAYGKALADDGQYAQAKDVLARSYPVERPDWTILSVQGSVEDRLDNHETAQKYYSEALKISPGEPSILSNLGLSYALTRQLPLAEQTLRQAAASPHSDTRERQNLALVLSLEGKFGEAEEISRRDMSPEAAAANVQAIRSMIAQNDSWKALQNKASKGRVKEKGASDGPRQLPLAPDPDAG